MRGSDFEAVLVHDSSVELPLCNTCAVPVEVSGGMKQQFARASGWGCAQATWWQRRSEPVSGNVILLPSALFIGERILSGLDFPHWCNLFSLIDYEWLKWSNGILQILLITYYTNYRKTFLDVRYLWFSTSENWVGAIHIRFGFVRADTVDDIQYSHF